MNDESLSGYSNFDLLLEVSPFVDGEAIPSESADTLELFNPANGQSRCYIPAGCDADAQRAIVAARKAFDDGRWSKLQPSRRRNILLEWADLIEGEAKRLNAMDAADMGKPISIDYGEAKAAANLIRNDAWSVDKISGDVISSDEFSLVATQRVPRGVVAAITPWNYPTYNAVMKLSPALATGNTVILKPSENSPHSAQRLVELAMEAGMPGGVLNLVPGKGETVGRVLGTSLDVDMVTFTGSGNVGKLMLQYAGQSNMKLVHAECGGKTPQIVFADCCDLEAVAANVASMILINQGQLCFAGSRLLVQKDIENELVNKVIEQFKNAVIGHPLDIKTTFGPLVNQQQMNRVLKYIEDGKKVADVAYGGQSVMRGSGGYYVGPTLFTKVPFDSSIAQEEIFGPVLATTSFDDTEEAVRLANSTVYGLGAHVWTSDLSRGMRLCKDIRAASVVVHATAQNGEGPGHGYSFEPYGQSGVGVESGTAGMESYLRRQTAWFDHD